MTTTDYQQSAAAWEMLRLWVVQHTTNPAVLAALRLVGRRLANAPRIQERK